MVIVDVQPTWPCAECAHPASEHLGITRMPCQACDCADMRIDGDFLAAALVVLPSHDGEPTCHCGRLAEDDYPLCGQCNVRQYQSPDGRCCPEQGTA